MIRALKSFVSWLESRFPEKVVVTAAEYGRLGEALTRVIDRTEALMVEQSATVSRVATLEASSVHKDAVKELIAAVLTIKNDVDAMKVNLGWGKQVEKAAELQAMLNGEVI